MHADDPPAAGTHGRVASGISVGASEKHQPTLLPLGVQYPTKSGGTCPTSAVGQEPPGKGAGPHPSPDQRQQGAALSAGWGNPCTHEAGFGLPGAGPGKGSPGNASVAEQKHSAGC